MYNCYVLTIALSCIHHLCLLALQTMVSAAIPYTMAFIGKNSADFEVVG